MAYEWFVSLRYLRAKRKQTFISVISFISIAGVTLGVADLIVVMAVMTGFHDGVRKQILGNIPHVLIQKEGGDISHYQEVVKKALAVSPYIRTATPYVAKEAMLLSHRNVAAVSVGVVNERGLVDLCYTEDVAAAVDMNLVMNARGEFIELQGTGEEATFTDAQLLELLTLGKAGIKELLAAQQTAIAAA